MRMPDDGSRTVFKWGLPVNRVIFQCLQKIVRRAMQDPVWSTVVGCSQ
jgi:hypothetical protein